MTSRVQKGSTVFRPLVKSKARNTPTPRPTSQSRAPLSSGHSSSLLAASLPPESRRAEHNSDTVIVSSTGNASSNELSPSQLSRSASIPPVLASSKSTPATLITVSQSRHPNHALPESPSPDINGSRVILDNTTESSPARSVPTVISHLSPSERNSDTLQVERKQRSRSLINRENSPESIGTPVKNNSVQEAPKKRKRNVPKVSEGNTSDNANGKNKKIRAASVGGSRQRRSRGPSLPPFDPDADPGDEIDPTVITMASLCEDTGHGRVSSKAPEILSNHAAWKARNREKRAQMKAFMEAKKYGKEEEDDISPKATNDDSGPSNSAPEKSDDGNNNGNNNTDFDYSRDIQTSRFNVQVRIGPNGETIIDEESLVVDRVEHDDTLQYTHVTESDTTKFVNSGTYSRRYRGSRWSAEETELFYNALSQYGENYELMAYVLPGRDRKSCKNKFKAEDKKNHARINYCLNNRIPVDMTTLSRMTGKDFTGPVPEIRVLTPVPSLPVESDAPAAIGNLETVSDQTEVKKRRNKTASNDEVVIVGDVDTYDT